MPTNLTHILQENQQRNDKLKSEYNPLLGIGCIGQRIKLLIPDFALPDMLVNEQVYFNPLIKTVAHHGSISRFITEHLHTEDTPDMMEEVGRWILRMLIMHDFEFCAYYLFIIKDKLSPEEIPFKLNRPQRRLLAKLEGMRLANAPIRLILLKARQWGGSTLIQLYIAWIQLFHKKNWNSLTVAHIKDTSNEIKGMYSLLLSKIPAWVM